MARIIRTNPDPFPFLGSEDSTNRPEGRHVTSVIMDLLWTARLIKFDPGKEPDEMGRRRMEEGFRWEDELVRAFADRLLHARPEPRCVDGLWMSPDGITDRNEEFKSTAKKYKDWLEWSSIHDPKWLYWVEQAKAYCYGFGVAETRWWVKFHTPWGVEFDNGTVVRFEQWELEENWERLMNHKMTMEGRTDERTA